MLAIFVFVAWILVLVTILSDLFRDHDLSGWGKAAWVLFLIFMPFLAALIYLIARGGGMRERAIKARRRARSSSTPTSSRPAAASTADEVAKLAKLRDDGTISAEEFERRRGSCWPEAQTSWSRPHSLGFLSSRQRTILEPWRMRPPLVWS